MKMKNIEIEEQKLPLTQLDKKDIAIGIGAFIGLLLFWFFVIQGVKNQAISYEESIKQTYSYVKAEEQRRLDLIPNLVECVRAYSEYEYKTTLELVKARSGDGNIDSIAHSCEGDLLSREVQDKISVVVERYPDLKAQKNYQDLMNELSITENRIVSVRKAYNQEVTRYKSFVRQFPSKQLLKLTDYEVIDYERLEFGNISTNSKLSF